MPKNNTIKVVEIKAEFYADSHGRQLPQMIDLCSNGKIFLNGVLVPGSDMEKVYSLAAKSQNIPLMLVAGTNYMSKRSPVILITKKRVN